MSTIPRPERGALSPYPSTPYFAIVRGASVIYGRLDADQREPAIPYLRATVYSRRTPAGRAGWVNEQALTPLYAVEFDALAAAGWPAKPERMACVLGALSTLREAA